MSDTPERNRYDRALFAAVSRLSGPHATAGHKMAAELDHRLLTEHAPADGPGPECKGCGEPWPCGRAEGAMRMVGVYS